MGDSRATQFDNVFLNRPASPPATLPLSSDGIKDTVPMRLRVEYQNLYETIRDLARKWTFLLLDAFCSVLYGACT
jgi:hypothetical protein